jgi:glycerol uptake facilitator-like aquaporin
MIRALAAETLGTALLVATVIGSAQMAATLTPDHGLLLSANAGATGAILYVLITILAPLSGAHFNPLVSALMVLRGTLSPRSFVLYAIAQTAGALAGMLLAHAMFALPLLQMATQSRGGPAQDLAEAIATFGLILTILGGLHARANVAAIVASYIAAAYWFTSSTSFATPVMLLARAFTNTPSGITASATPGFLLAEITGTALAATLGLWLFRKT